MGNRVSKDKGVERGSSATSARWKTSSVGLACAISAIAAGCGQPQDTGVVMGCFGFVNENIPGQDLVSTDVVTNSYFGGCDPNDPGMQVVERATPEAAANADAMVAACNVDCKARLDAYAAAHPEVALPLACQTLFASPCDGLFSDVSGLAAGASKFQAGGPADNRFTLTGTVIVTVDGRQSDPAPATGIVDATMGPCTGGGQSCQFFVSRLDVVSTAPFSVNGVLVDSAHIQNQGAATGSRTPTDMHIPAQAIEAAVNASLDGMAPSNFHVTNNAQVGGAMTGPTSLASFFSNFNLTFTQTNGQDTVKVAISMTGTPIGSPPVAAFTPTQTTYECQCQSCTTVEFTSAATDPDNDLQSLSWQLDTKPQLGDASGAPEFIDAELGLGQHKVSLVATDSRGAASESSLTFNVVDTTPPVVTPPPNVALTSCSFPDIGQATATDLCSSTILISSDAPGSYQVGTTTVTWTAEDGSGNDGTATQTVTMTQVSDMRTCCPAGYNVIVIPQGNTAVVNGTSGNDCIIGTSNTDRINGLGGDDIIFGLGGQDIINGGDGNDIILGGDGDDIIDGGNGDDKIAGGSGQNHIEGGAGNDTIIGGDGDDYIDGGDGADIIYGGAGQDHLTGGLGNDFIDGGPGDDQIVAQTTNPVTGLQMSVATGNGGDDTLLGGIGNDTIVDTVGNNTLEGFTGDDHLTGGPGNDTLNGGSGHDKCSGGGGMDNLMSCND